VVGGVVAPAVVSAVASAVDWEWGGLRVVRQGSGGGGGDGRSDDDGGGGEGGRKRPDAASVSASTFAVLLGASDLARHPAARQPFLFDKGAEDIDQSDAPLLHAWRRRRRRRRLRRQWRR